MTINQLADVYYTEEVTYELTGVGSKIPIFIGRTGNSETTYTLPKTNETVTYKVDGTQFHKFEGYSKVNQPIDKGGIGVESHIENAGLSNETEVSHLGIITSRKLFFGILTSIGYFCQIITSKAFKSNIKPIEGLLLNSTIDTNIQRMHFTKHFAI